MLVLRAIRSILPASLKARRLATEARQWQLPEQLVLCAGGACFTWGNAAGGRLGLGSCLSDGADAPAAALRVAVFTLQITRLEMYMT